MKNLIINISVTLLNLIIILLLCAGCRTVGPDYAQPSPVLPDKWSTDEVPDLAASFTSTNSINTLTNWWNSFNDPLLSELINQARTNNLEIKQAEARLRKARAQRDIAKADKGPTVNLNGSASRSRGSEKTGSGETSTHYSNGFDATWEADLFGGKHRAEEAAQAGLDAAGEDLRDVLVSLTAEVALNYVDYCANRKRLEITESNLVSQTETYRIADWRQQANLVTQLDVDQAKMSLEQTRAQLPSLRTGISEAEHQLETLLGLLPGKLKALLESHEPDVPVATDSIAIGVPADVLRQRPDIRKAERELAAQTAQIGVAEAARYPDLTLSGSVGLEALLFGDLYTTGARTAQGAVSAAWTLFDGGKLRRQVEIETAYQEELFKNYEETVLTALQEVEDAITAYANERQRHQTLLEAAKAGQSAFNLAYVQYSSGLVDFESVLSTQQSLLNIQDTLASSEAQLTTDLISLYKTLGGGWEQILTFNLTNMEN